jgi:hypothetical protein
MLGSKIDFFAVYSARPNMAIMNGALVFEEHNTILCETVSIQHSRIIYIHYGKIPDLYNLKLITNYLWLPKMTATIQIKRIKAAEEYIPLSHDCKFYAFDSLPNDDYVEYFQQLGGQYRSYNKDVHMNNNMHCYLAVKNNKVVGSLWAKYRAGFNCEVIKLVHIAPSIDASLRWNILFDLVDKLVHDTTRYAYFKNTDFSRNLTEFLHTTPKMSSLSW